MKYTRLLFATILMMFLLLSLPTIVMAEGDADNPITDQDDVYSVFLKNHCRCQIPEANDDYVSVLVDMPNPNTDGITGDQIASELFRITVPYNGIDYLTSYSIDETDSKEQFVFTTPSGHNGSASMAMPALRNGGEISVKYEFLSDDGTNSVLAERTELVTACAAFKNAKFAKRALKLKITPKKKAYTFNGKYNKPALTVVAKYGTQTIPAGALSYTSSYASSKSVGTASVSIALTGDYTGKASAKYKINPKGTKISSAKALKKGFKVTWKKQGAKMANSRITGYQIQYSTVKTFKKGNKTLTVKGFKKTSKKVTKLKAKKKYFIRVRTYKSVNGTKYYSGWSAAKAITTKK